MIRFVKSLIVLAVALGTVPTAFAADEKVSASLCEILKEMNLSPEVKSYLPAGAKAQLVMATSEKFGDSPESFRDAWKSFDAVATERCPKERDAMLAVLKTKTLAEALD